MPQATSEQSTWTAMDLTHRFGAIPLNRVVRDPAPGTATVADVLRLDDHDNRLCELIDGTLVEKPIGAYESFLAGKLITLLNIVLAKTQQGIVLGEAGMLQLFPEQVRIPDVSYICWERLQGSGFPENPVPLMAPDLAVEIISKSNTNKEMQRKLGEYFQADVQLVWFVDPRLKQVRVYTSASDVTTLGEAQTLTGGNLLPGVSIDLTEFFAAPTSGTSKPID